MQIYFINRTILGTNTTLTNYWQASPLPPRTLHAPVFMTSDMQVRP